MVSVVIPVYNAEQYVRRAVESALAQEETGEVLLVEDNSPDNALAICYALEKQNSKVRVLRHPDGKNRGISASRNLGILNSQCEYIAFLDADDYYLPGRFQLAMEILTNSPDTDGVYETTGIEFESESFRQQWIDEKKVSVFAIKQLTSDEQLLSATVRGKVNFHMDGIIVRKSLFDETGLFEEELIIGEDTAMRLKMAVLGKLVAGRVDGPVAIRFIHTNNNATHQTIEIWREAYRLMWRTIWAWSQSKNLDDEKRMLLLNRLIASECLHYAKHSVIIRHFEGISHMFKYIRRNPRQFNLSDIAYVTYNRSGIIGISNALSSLIERKRG